MPSHAGLRVLTFGMSCALILTLSPLPASPDVRGGIFKVTADISNGNISREFGEDDSMFTLKMSTHYRNLMGVDGDGGAGKAIADALRAVADDVEQRINIAPGEGDWVPEHYRTTVDRQWIKWSLTGED